MVPKFSQEGRFAAGVAAILKEIKMELKRKKVLDLPLSCTPEKRLPP